MIPEHHQQLRRIPPPLPTFSALCPAALNPGPNTWEGADIKLGRAREPEQQQQEGGVEEEAGATIHNRLNQAMQERGPVIRASVRSRESLQNRIRDNPMLAKLASMGAAKPQQLQVARRTSRRGKEMKPIVDPATGLYINKEKPSVHQAVKRSRTISKKNVPLAVRLLMLLLAAASGSIPPCFLPCYFFLLCFCRLRDQAHPIPRLRLLHQVDWGDGIDPPHAPKDYVAAPEKMAQRRAKIIAERGAGAAASSCAELQWRPPLPAPTPPLLDPEVC